MRFSARVILIQDGQVALIRRVRRGRTYHVFPGGKVEQGETPEQAAVREAYEELGLEVELERLAAVVEFRGGQQHYYLARAVGGQFGTGTGEEMSSPPESPRGSYTPVWVPLGQLQRYEIRPRQLAWAIADLVQEGPVLRFKEM